jgi:endonuclease/exonuclease/phosphatase family metal-dependent hydrolase
MVMTSLAAKVLSTRFTLLPKSPGLHQRAVAMAEVELRGSRWAIAAVHLGVDADERSRHLDPLYAFVGASESPLVVGGDFNNEPGGPIWQSLADRLQDAYAVAPDGPADTYPARRPRRRIDGIFADPDVDVVACRAVHDIPGVELVAASDHLPVLALLRQ